MLLPRRGFLNAVLLAAGLITPRFQSLITGLAGRGTGARATGRRLAGCLRETRSARVVGQAYLASLSTGADLESLVARLWPSRAGRAETPALRQWLWQQSRDDFAAGRTVSVDGWLLSETEAGLCAVVALL